MLSIISSKIALGLGGALIIGTLILGINDYMNVRASYKIAQKQIAILENRREQVDSQMIKVEKKINDNFNKRQKALLEVQLNGHISTDTGNNPMWMRTYANSNR